MPYITSFERLAKEEGEARGRVEGRVEGRAEGLQDGIAIALRVKFGEAGGKLADEVRQIADWAILGRIINSIERSKDVAEVRQAWMGGN